MKTFWKPIFLLVALASASAQSTDKAPVVQEIVKVLAEIGFTDYVAHFEDNYLTSTSDNSWAAKNTQLGLDNLVSTCLQSPRDQWHQIILSHFQRMKGIKAEAAVIDPQLERFDTALPYLRTRLYPLAFVASLKEGVYRKNPLGFAEVVVVDYPSTVGSLRSDYLLKWKKTADEVLDTATAATLKDNQETYQAFGFKYNSTIYLMTSITNLYVTTDILDAHLKGAPVGTLGSFVSVPNRINMPVLVLDSKETLNALTMEFLMLTQYMYKLGPGSLSENFFWFDGERLYPVEHDPQQGAIMPPDELIKRLQP